MIRDRDVIDLLRLEGDKLARLQDACERLPADDPHRQQLPRLMFQRATNFSVACGDCATPTITSQGMLNEFGASCSPRCSRSAGAHHEGGAFWWRPGQPNRAGAAEPRP